MKNLNILDDNNVRNLMSMLNSPDSDNKYIAIESIKQLDLTNSADFVLLLYNFAEMAPLEWENVPNVMEILQFHNVWTTKSSVECIKRLREKELCTSNEAFTLFCELESVKLREQLKVWGYPVEFIDIEIKFKTNV